MKITQIVCQILRIENVEAKTASSQDAVIVRVRTDSGRPELTDISVLGVWLALSQRDQFVAFLAQNNGDVKALTAHMRQTAAQYR